MHSTTVVTVLLWLLLLLVGGGAVTAERDNGELVTKSSTLQTPPVRPVKLFSISEIKDLESYLGIERTTNFVGGLTSNKIPTGGKPGMFNMGNIINTSFETAIEYSQTEIVHSSAFGVNSSYVTTKTPTSYFVLQAATNQLPSFYFSGELDNNGEGNVDSFSFTMDEHKQTSPSFVCKWLCFAKRNWGGDYYPIYHVIIVSVDQPSVAEASEEVSPTSQSDFHRISGLEDSKYLVALLFFGKKGEVLVEKDFFNTTTRLMEHVFPGSEFQNFTLRTTMTRQVENSPSSSNTLIIIISSVSAMVVCASVIVVILYWRRRKNRLEDEAYHKIRESYRGCLSTSELTDLDELVMPSTDRFNEPYREQRRLYLETFGMVPDVPSPRSKVGPGTQDFTTDRFREAHNRLQALAQHVADNH